MPCANCYTGHDHPGPVYGREAKLHGHDVYIAEPQTKGVSQTGLIVILSDVFGWDTTNLRGVADRYAERTGCRVYLPDFMHGTSAPGWTKGVIDRILNEGGLLEWLAKPWLILKAAWVMIPCNFRNNPKKRYPAIRQFMDDLRCNEAADLKVGAVGFCWGAYGVNHLAQGDLARNDKTLIDAGFTAHPSEVEVPRDFEGIKLPYSMSIGDVDFALPLKEVEEAAKILEAKKNIDTEVVIIPNAKHGFAVRGNPNNKIEKEMADQAEDQLVRWFTKHLA
ncbi:DLH domain-containing protein [Fusarium sp. LHS14.1]|nr:DLH domain-containing protein [Fusarium sp. LHS14.1]